MRPARRRAEVRDLQAWFGVSERRAQRAADWPRSTHRYQSQAADQTALRMRLRDLALARSRYGYPRLIYLEKPVKPLDYVRCIQQTLRIEVTEEATDKIGLKEELSRQIQEAEPHALRRALEALKKKS